MNDSTLDLFEEKADEENEISLMADHYKVTPEYYKLEFILSHGK
jgi:hypothetical protein